MRFAEPLALIALILAPLAMIAWRLLERRRDRQLHRAGDIGLLSEMSSLGSDRGKTARFWEWMLLAAALALVAVALARPQFGVRTETRRARGMNVVLALDLSKSMLARDVVPSRLERARVELGELIDQLKGDRIGLVGFTSVALPLCPLTVDHAALKLQLRSAAPGDLPRGGTAIADAIRAGKQMLENGPKEGGGRAILVVTDGEENEGEPLGATKEAKEAGIEVHVVGVGSRTGEPIPLFDDKGNSEGYLKDQSGQTVISRLNEQILKSIAETGGGLAALPGETGGLDLVAIRSHLLRMKREDREKRTVRVHEERYRWALAPAFLLLLLSTVVRPRSARRERARLSIRGGAAAVGLCLALPFLIGAGPFQRQEPETRAGNQALADGRAKEALEAYDRAKAKVGEDPRLLYNRGLAQAAAGELDAAISDLSAAASASTDPALRAQASFALGNAYRSLKKLDPAIDAYRQALIDDPKNTAARRNLELSQAIKRIQALQPKDPNQKNEDGEKKPPENRDGGVPDGGGGGDGGSGAPDGGTSGGDGGEGASDGGGEQNGQADGGGGGSDGASDQNQGADASSRSDGGTANPKEGEQGPEPKDLDQQSAEQILDSLREQEQALKRKQLLKKVRPGTVVKDW